MRGERSKDERVRTIVHSCPADWAYEEGFAENVRRREDGGVRLHDRDLIEDDAPGAGASDKGCIREALRAGVEARKALILRDNRAKSAKVVFYVEEVQGNSRGLLITVNGHRLRLPPLKEAYPEQTGRSAWQYLEFPTHWLKRGANRIVLRSEGNEEKDDPSWRLCIARADEFEDGGGGERKPGMRSFKSKDFGRTWSRSLGDTEDVAGEYLVRLSLTRFVSEGVLTSPVMDMWSEASDGEVVKRQGRTEALTMSVSGSVPEGTSIGWQVRTGSDFDPCGEGWSVWKTVLAGAKGKVGIPGRLKRYIQWRTVLRTANPLRTPVVKKVVLQAKVAYASAVPRDVFVVDHHNEKIERSSIPFEYENPDEARLKELRRKCGLDDIVQGAATDFQEMVLLRHWVAAQWQKGASHGGYGTYPPWDALEIMRRARGSKKCGGMCMQFAIVLIQALISRGIHARHINKMHHEVVEAWSNDYGKWVFMDPTSNFDCHNYDLRTGEPLNALEMHQAWVAKFVDEPVDWRRGAEPFNRKQQRGEVREQPVGFSTLDPKGRISKGYYPGYNLAGYFRMVPRNNYSSKPTPRPLAHGCMSWPWNGYLNWENPIAGIQPQYSWYSDRKRDFYPTLNQVQFDATYGTAAGTLGVRMVTFTPGFDTFLVNVDGKGWVESPAAFTWELHPGLNRLEMRSRSKSRRCGIISHLVVNYQPSAVPGER